jgi:diguanylate cyclase (GGDEF)-like protein/PAS domain S-box-containing protein
LSDAVGNSVVVFEELLQFLYLTPVGIVKFSVDGTIDLINPVASQVLLPLVPKGNLDNLYESLAPLVPNLGQLVGKFIGDAGVILDQQRLEAKVGGKTLVLSLTVNRVNERVYMAVLRDVTKIAEQERKLFDDQQRFRAIFNHVRDYAIYTITLDGMLEEWNRSLQRFGGWAAADVQGRHFGMFFPSDDPSLPDPEALLEQAKRIGSVETEGWRLKRDGSRLWGNTVITALPDEAGAVRGFVVVARDMTERKRMEDELKQFATIDPLTGAFNRRHGNERLAAEFDRRAKSGRPCAVMMLDIDRFKSINDEHGHDAGDAVLCAIVRTCNAGLRTVDMLARWGGEEFLILLPDTDAEAAVAIAERLRAAVAVTRVPIISDGSIAFTVSIGVASPVSNDLHDLLRRADGALYAAKTGGRNRVVLATLVPESDSASSENLNRPRTP